MRFSNNYAKETAFIRIKKWMPEKKLLGVIVVLVALFVSAPFLFETTYELFFPVVSMTDVIVIYDNAMNGTYHASFQLKNTAHLWVASDGTVNIEITRDNNILYEKTFAVYKSQFRQGPTLGGTFTFYKWTFPASDVHGLPAPLTESAIDPPTNVMATITFTTPQGKTLTGNDDVYPYVDWGKPSY